jgi:hypothetical protein
VEDALGRPPQIPESLANIEDKPTRCKIMDADKNAIQEFVAQNADETPLNPHQT